MATPISAPLTFEPLDPKQVGRIAVLLGGRSAERPVSLNSGAEVLKALQASGFDAFGIDVYGPDGSLDPITQLTAQPIDCAFIALHGPGGEDGVMQGTLEMMGIPYTGSGVMASALGMDKLRCKQLWSGMGLSTPTYTLLTADTDWQAVVAELGLPIMVKPAHEGSSIGMSKVERAEDLQKAYEDAAQYDDYVLAESWITGSEFTIAILAGQALPVIRLQTPHQFYDYQAKYHVDTTGYYFDNDLAEQQVAELQQLSVDAFNAVGCKGWGRVDVMQSADGRFWLLEVNTIPGMTDHSLVPMAAKQAGLSFSELCQVLLKDALATAPKKPKVGG